MLALDASAAVYLITTSSGFSLVQGFNLIAPSLVWSEATSALHALQWRGEVTTDLAGAALDRLLAAPIQQVSSPDLHREAWNVAEALGWAKTYDAEYVALARMQRCPLLTVDERLRRGATRMVEVITPSDL